MPPSIGSRLARLGARRGPTRWVWAVTLAACLVGGGALGVAVVGSWFGFGAYANAVALNDVISGDCFDPLGQRFSANAELVSCSDPHSHQAFGVFTFDDATFPGNEAAEARAQDFCRGTLELIPVNGLRENIDYTVDAVVPTQQTWAKGDRMGLCMFSRVGGAHLVGSFLDGTVKVQPAG